MLNRYWNHLWNEMSETGRETFRWDLLRGAAIGTTSTLQLTFALVIAIHYHDAGFLQKSIIAGAFSAGLLLSLPYASWSPIIKRKTLRAALPGFLAALGILPEPLRCPSAQRPGESLPKSRDRIFRKENRMLHTQFFDCKLSCPSASTREPLDTIVSHLKISTASFAISFNRCRCPFDPVKIVFAVPVLDREDEH